MRLVACVLALGVSAHAATISIVSPTQPTLFFKIPDRPSPSATLDGVQLGYLDVPGFLDGSPLVIGRVLFSPEVEAGGLFTRPIQYVSYGYDGPQLYVGPEHAPTWRPGVYVLSNGQTGLDDTVTVGVPEPSTWAMMLLGFGLVGYAARHRSKCAVRGVGRSAA